MTLVASMRARLYRDEIARCEADYAGAQSDDERASRQLAALNREWARSSATTDHWGALVRSRRLPAEFASLDEFVRVVPITSRQAAQEHGGAMTSRSRRPDRVRMTGGSTSAPLQLPAWSSEYVATRPDLWFGRRWYGVDPASRLFLLWGHSHLLGTGLRGWTRARKQEISDGLLGYRRFSAYDLQPAQMRRAADELLRFRPEFVIGYSVALDLLARANADRRAALRSAGLRVIVGTSESFPSPDSEERLRDTFGCPVAMEYGAVECGIVAHTHPDGGYRVFWRNHLVEAVGEGRIRRIVVTSLYPRAFPLVRFEIGDEIEIRDGAPARAIGLAEFQRVVGRCNDYVVLSDGFTVHSEVFSHAVRPCADVRGFQIVQQGDALAMRYTSTDDLPQEQRLGIQTRLERVHPALAAIRFERVPALSQTVAGKTRMVIRG